MKNKIEIKTFIVYNENTKTERTFGMAKGYAFLAEGFEETELTAVVDILLRAGMRLELFSVTDNLYVKGAHGITIGAQHILEDTLKPDMDLIFLPGGMPGTTNLLESSLLRELLLQADSQGKHIAAICAAPSILGSLGILKGKKAVCYPGFEEQLEGARISGEGVVTDGTITTAKGMGTAIDLGLELVKIFFGEEKSKDIAESIQYSERGSDI